MKVSYKGMNLEGTPQEILLFISLYDGPRVVRNDARWEHRSSNLSTESPSPNSSNYLPQISKSNFRQALKNYEQFSWNETSSSE